MDKYDVKIARKNLYSAPTSFSVVEVPPLQYLAIDGAGDPNTSEAYAAALEALYGVAYSIKFAAKNTLERDFVVAPLEGLWRSDNMDSFVTRDKNQWQWTMMINLPDFITSDMVDVAIDSVAAKKQLPALKLLRLMTLAEGTSVQVLHVGSYDDEALTLDTLHHEYLPAHKLTFNGDHHEIYLGDPRKSAPEKLRTILRQPVRAVAAG